METAKLRSINGWETVYCKALSIAPYFTNMLQHRMNKKLATNVVITGEGGIGKSYLATDIARVYEGADRMGKDRMSIDQVVYVFAEYMDLLVKLPMGRAIVFDEPSYAMGKRDWYKELNKVLVQTMESQRFLIHPVYIPIINKALLDKTVRSYLIQFQIHVWDRGKATVYRISASQNSEKVYRYTVCELYYKMFDNDVCPRDSCLGCNIMVTCPLFRAQYERKKATIQLGRYEQAKTEAAAKESTKYTEPQLVSMLYPLREQFMGDRGKADVQRIRIVARTKFGIEISGSKAGALKKLLLFQYPADFPNG